ncbi:MAG: MiaB/RimO family radical SAM methylthiotransferase [Patescibacteria group bacterium]
MKFASYSFGCRLNQAEKEDLDQRLLARGLVFSEDRPDFYFINTCAVTGKAEREARQLIGGIKNKWPGTKLVVTGCATTKWLSEGFSVSGIDLWIDNRNKENIVELVLGLFQTGTVCDATVQGTLDDKFINSGRRYIKIQEGCSRYCSYCLVPFLRGPSRSRPISEITVQINQLGDKLAEAVLTAVNTEYFGKENGETLPRLVESLLNKTAVKRLSFGSINPWSLTPELLEVYRKYFPGGRLTKYFHVPLQSGSNRILKLMNRGYTLEEFSEKIKAVNALDPLVLIGTDVLAGFPGETDGDFHETYRFLESYPINKFHVFRFSLRDNTAAVRLVKELGEVPSAVKIFRSRRLKELGQNKYRQFLTRHLNRNFPALFLVESRGGFRKALLDNQVSVLVAPYRGFPGEIRVVRVRSLKGEQLFGEEV